MAFKLKCTACGEKFPWVKDKEIHCCPQCGIRFDSDRPDDDVAMPFFRSQKTKNNDKLYRDIEAGSERRAEMAAEMAGVPVSEMSGLKVTNLNDRKDAEIMAMPVQNDVTKFMEQNKVGGFQGANGAEYSAAVQTGPFANSGAKMRTALQQHHSNISGGTAVVDRPAAETTQPGYRRRG